MDKLVFLHLSDIHFSKPEPTFDLDIELRNQIELDVQRMTDGFQQATGILLCGDIAFSGARDEYDRASDWIKKLQRLAAVEDGNVWTVPGNHDVNRQTVRKSQILQDVHARLRGIPENSINEQLKQYLNDELEPHILFEPIKNYNLFAVSFDCDSTPEQLFWEKDLPLNDGSTLKIRGLNSSLISDESDDDERRSLILSSFQIGFQEDASVTYMSMCHHPPHLIRQEDEFEDCLQARVAVQLFGHKHRQRLNVIDDRLRISAGAVHPSRRESGWEPRYNWVSIYADSIGDQRNLIVEVWPRIWDQTRRTFEPEVKDGRESRIFPLPLKPWQGKEIEEHQPHALPREKGDLTVGKARYLMEPKRKLVYRFLSLPYNQIIEIAVTLNLLTDKDKGVEGLELFKRFIERAEKREMMDKLWDAVEQKYGNANATENPFGKRELERS